MAITRISTSSLKNLNKYDDMLAGNSPYIPSSFYSIATLTPTGVNNVTFTSIPSTYKSLQLRWINMTQDDIVLVLNGDNGNNYTSHNLTSSSGGVYPGWGISNPYVYVDAGWYTSNGTAPEVAIIDFQDYASTTKNKTMRIVHGSDRNSTTTGDISLVSSLWLNTNAINSIKVFSSGATNFASGTSFALYGIN